MCGLLRRFKIIIGLPVDEIGNINRTHRRTTHRHHMFIHICFNDDGTDLPTTLVQGDEQCRTLLRYQGGELRGGCGVGLTYRSTAGLLWKD